MHNRGDKNEYDNGVNFLPDSCSNSNLEGSESSKNWAKVISEQSSISEQISIHEKYKIPNINETPKTNNMN